jgi:hypothetical protein
MDVVRALERFKRAYTGATPKFYDPTRQLQISSYVNIHSLK